MAEHIFYFTGPRIGLGAFANNFGWLQFRYFLAGILVIWATCSFAQESLLNGSDLAPLEACVELRLNDAGTINEPVATRSGQRVWAWQWCAVKQKLFCDGIQSPSQSVPLQNMKGWMMS